jgi:hypothetical protein
MRPALTPRASCAWLATARILKKARLRARGEMNVGELCDLYLVEGVATKKPATVLTEPMAFFVPAHGRKVIDLSRALQNLPMKSPSRQRRSAVSWSAIAITAR